MDQILPPVPEGLKLFAWHGMAMPVPAEWNLSFHAGGWGRGALVISDVQGPAIEVRWRRPRLAIFGGDSRRDLSQMERRLRRRLDVSHVGDCAVCFRRDGATILLAADSSRIYEVTLRRPEAADEIAGYFVTAVVMLANARRWPWAVYAIRGDAPARARLRAASLLPGDSRLTLAARVEIVELGAFSMTDRQLLGRTLRQWAEQSALVRASPRGTWQEAEGALIYAAWKRSFLIRGRWDKFTIEHDSMANCIRWSRREARTSAAEAGVMVI